MKFDAFDLLENAGWPALMIEGGGTIRRANQAATAIFGPKLEGETTSLGALWPEHSESAEQFLSRWERSAPTTVPLHFCGKGGAVHSFSTYISAVHRDGQKRFLFQLFPTPPPPEPAAPPLAPGSEAGAEGAAGETTVVQRQRLDCALHLTRTVALDFNNALTSILGHVSLLLSKMDLSHPFRTSMLEIEKAAEKAAEVAQQLSSFSRQEKESKELPATNLNTLVRRAVAMFQHSGGHGANYTALIDHKPLAVRLDEAKVLQAFVKILENAREAVGEYGNIRVTSRSLELTTSWRDENARLQPGHYACVEVTDDGPGMAPEVLGRVFEPFFSTKEGHRGLGMAWVYGVVTNHGGAVALSSRPKRGTSVRVYLPVSKSQVKESQAKATPAGPQTVLIVDDEDLLLTMGTAILSSAGYKVLTANSGPKALEMLSRRRSMIDLVITDMVMPQMSGRELVEQIDFMAPQMPIIKMSGYVRPDGGEAEAYLQKPFTTEELLRVVKQALDGDEAN